MNSQYRRDAARHGLTLMELLVVLVILIGLAGILVPMLPSVLTRTHTATAATNMGEIARTIGTYQSLYGTPYPDGWDTLLDSTGAVAIFVQYSQSPNAPAGDSATGSLMAVGGLVTVYPLLAGDAAALSNGGINTLYTFATGPVGSATGPADPTFYPYGPVPGALPASVSGGTIANPIAVPTGTKVAALSPVAIAQLGLNPNANYVIFGLGSYNSMVGRNMVNAPVHFSDDGAQAPTYYYARFGVIFKIGNYAGPGQTGTYTPSSQATLAGVVDISCDSGLAGINAHIQEYYQAVQASQ
jgi:Tfp pilus assembly protein PilE